MRVSFCWLSLDAAHYACQVPEAVQRLDLEGLEGPQRQQAIEQWYAQEREMLLVTGPGAGRRGTGPAKKQPDQIEQQRTVLLKDL